MAGIATMPTTIQVSEELADELADRKGRGDTYEDVIWALIDDRESAREAPESAPDREPDPSPARERAPQHDGTGDASEGLRERIDALDEVPGSGGTEAARRDAIEAMAEVLRERGTAEKSDLLAVVDADAVGYSSEASFWSNCIKGKNTLKALDSVQTPPEGGRVWRWVGKN